MNTQVTVGSILSRTVEIYGKRIGLLLGMAAVLFIPAGIIDGILSHTGFLGSMLGSIVRAVAVALFTGAVVRVVQAEDSSSEPGSIGEIFSSISDRIWPLIWVGIVAGIATAIGLVLFIVPGLFLMTIWAVYQPTIVVEHVSFDSLGRRLYLF